MKNALSFRTTFESLYLVINKNLAEIDYFVVHIIFAFISFNKLDLLIIRSVGIRRQYFVEQFCINCPPILQIVVSNPAAVLHWYKFVAQKWAGFRILPFQNESMDNHLNWL